MTKRAAEIEQARLLKSLRVCHGKTQQEIANHLGVKRTSYVQMENAKRKCFALELKAICDYFAVSYKSMFVGYGG